ncbi:MAG: serine/threonine-protein kinase [Polyangiales bacterium]
MSEAPPPPPPDAAKGADPLIGRVINDRYKISTMIARGGMGKVYRAEQAPLGRQVALKVLNPNYQGDNDPEFHKRFFLEASISAKLTHPNTVTIFDYGRTEDEIYYIAMELLEGRTLHRALRDEAPFEPHRALHIARQICRSLREAHQMGVIHRDLKPANIFLVRHGDESDFVKVLDFGLVKDLDKEGEDLTQTGLFMGSPKYMAPEQIRGEKVDGRTDVYALGVILYEMLTGKVPFDRPNSVNILMAHVHEAVPNMNDINPGAHVPPALQGVVMKAMAKKLDDRYSGMDEFINALKEAGEAGGFGASRSMDLSGDVSYSGLDSHSGSFTPSGGNTLLSSHAGTPSHGFPIAPAIPEPAPSNKGKIVAAVVVAAVVVGGAAAVLTKKPPPPPAPVATTTPAPAPTPPPPPPTGTTTATGPIQVQLRTTPPGATVVVGDKTYGPTPADIEWTGADAAQGREVTFQFHLEGYRDFTITRTVSTSPMVVSATLDALAASAGGGNRRTVRRPAGGGGGGGSTGSVGNVSGFKNEPY